MNLSILNRIFIALVITLVSVSGLNAQITDTLLATTKSREAAQLRDNGDFQGAIEILKEVAEFYKQNALWEKYLGVHIDLSTCYSEQSLYDEAKASTDILINKSQTLVSDPSRFQIIGYSTLGNIYYLNSDYDKTKEVYDKCLEITLKNYPREHSKTADAYAQLATLNEKTGALQKALDYNLIALEIREALLDKDDMDLAFSYGNIGLIYKRQGEFSKALDYYQKAQTILEGALGEEHPNVAIVKNNIARIYEATGNYESALSNYYQVLESLAKALGEDHPNIGLIKTNIGLVYLQQDRFEEAGEVFKASYDVWIKTFPEDHYYMGVYHNNMSIVYGSLARYSEALESVEKALAIYKVRLGADHPELAQILNNKAIFLSELQRYEEGLSYAEQALQLNVIAAHDGNFSFKNIYFQPNEYLRTQRIQSKAYIKQFQATKDLAYAQQAIGVHKETEEFINQRNKQNLPLDDQLIFNSIANSCLKQLVYNHLEVYRVLEEPQAMVDAFNYTEKSKAKILLQSTNLVEAIKYSGIPDEIIRQEQELKDSIAFYESEVLRFAQEKDSTKMVEYRNQKLFQAKLQLEALLQSMRSNYKVYHDMKYATEVTPLSEIQTSLDENTLLVSYTLDRRHYDEYLSQSTPFLYTFVISKDEVNVFRTEWNEQDDQLAESFYRLIQKSSIIKTKNRLRFIETGYALYQKLLEPISSAMEGKEKLVIIGEDILNYIPFEALVKNEKNQSFDKLDYLIKDFDISYHYSASLYTGSLKNKMDLDETNLFVFAPVFDNNEQNLIASDRQRFYSDTSYTFLRDNRFQPLLWSEKEALAIYELFQSRKNKNNKLFLRNDASEQALKKNIHQHKGIVHIASHSFANIKNPKFSGIACTTQDTNEMEDGILHAGEIYNIKLDADLVVLSSCESGLGQLIEGEGLLGLNRSFLYAGANNVLYSLWKVNDKISSELMVEFYRQLLQDKAYSNSLRESKLKLISNELTAAPNYWAPFLLVGQ